MTAFANATINQKIDKKIDISLRDVFEYCGREVNMMALGSFMVGAVSRPLLNPAAFNPLAIEGCSVFAAAGTVIAGWGLLRVFGKRLFELDLVYG